MEFTELKTEQRRQSLKQEIANLEQQLWARSRDVASWREISEMDLSEAAAIDERVVNNRDDEARSQLAMALLNVKQLEVKLRQTKAELASIDTAPKGSRRPAAEG